jgi:hypothetical protein
MRVCGEIARANKGKHIRLADNVVVCVELIRSKCSLYFCGLYMCVLMYSFSFLVLYFLSLSFVFCQKFCILFYTKIIFNVSNNHVQFFLLIYHYGIQMILSSMFSNYANTMMKYVLLVVFYDDHSRYNNG